ncbi:MAG: hypothetical protein HZB26_08985 [Candidatus Hydrogenedentes bacterium]|nr:hypothetical protein [Candidatus Hydrogenedentota bacterium]
MNGASVSGAPASDASGRRYKIIIFPLGYLLSHVGRCVQIGKALRARGHDVSFAGEDPDKNPRSRMGIARDAGFRLIYAREPNFAYAWDRFVKYGWTSTAWDLAVRHEEWAPLAKILEGHVEVMRHEKPDLVVADATISVSTAAYINGIPAVGVMNSHAARFISPTNFFMPAIHAFDALQLARIRRRVYKKYDRKPVDAIELLKSITLVSPDLPGLFNAPENWPNWNIIGPIHSEPNVPLPEWYEELSDGQPNVYITMGSTGIMDTFLRRTFDALGKLPCRFVLTTAGQAREDTLAQAPANFRITKYAPGSKILQHCQALIFHGGNGTMYQGLAAGVPMVALPSHVEQVYNIEPGIKHGFAVRLNPKRVKGKQIVDALDQVMNTPSFRQAAERFAGPVRDSDGAARAAEIFEQAAREGKPAGAELAARR